MKRRAWILAGLLATAGGWTASCLPGDTRPTPARVELTAEASPGTQQGLVTSDGWTITFERVAAAIGNVDLDGDDCEDYGRGRYQWLIDFTQAGEEKVGVIYGRGTCTLKFQLRYPSLTRTVYGAGADDALFEEMRDLFDDNWGADRIAVLVTGRAERDGIVKRFDWAFRRSFEYFRCPRLDGGGNLDVLQLVGGDRVERKVEIRAEELFRELPADEAPFVFDRYAEADCNDDGLIGFAELGTVSLEGVPGLGRGGAGGAGGSGTGSIPTECAVNGLNDDGTDFDTLADRVYDELLPRVARLSGGAACEPDITGVGDD